MWLCGGSTHLVEIMWLITRKKWHLRVPKWIAVGMQIFNLVVMCFFSPHCQVIPMTVNEIRPLDRCPPSRWAMFVAKSICSPCHPLSHPNYVGCTFCFMSALRSCSIPRFQKWIVFSETRCPVLGRQRERERERFHPLVDHFPSEIAITVGPIPHFQTHPFSGSEISSHSSHACSRWRKTWRKPWFPTWRRLLLVIWGISSSLSKQT